MGAPRTRRRDPDEGTADGDTGAGHTGSRLWLALGLLVAPALLAMTRPGPAFQVAVVIGGMLSAWGVWRFTAGGQWSVPLRCVLAGAAALPVGSLLISGLLLARGRRD